MAGTFLYFAYGSNLLRARILLRNPSAVFRTAARLEGYILGFDDSGDSRWFGAAGTILEAPGQHCWGVVWQLNSKEMHSLDCQERVQEGYYRPLEVDVTTPDGEQLTCRTYQLLRLGSEDKRPSPQYMDVIVRGAEQNGLPPDYIERLRQIENNGYSGDVNVYNEVNEKERQLKEK